MELSIELGKQCLHLATGKLEKRRSHVGGWRVAMTPNKQLQRTVIRRRGDKGLQS
jgi:hypothetical protein